MAKFGIHKRSWKFTREQSVGFSLSGMILYGFLIIVRVHLIITPQRYIISLLKPFSYSWKINSSPTKIQLPLPIYRLFQKSTFFHNIFVPRCFRTLLNSKVIGLDKYDPSAKSRERKKIIDYWKRVSKVQNLFSCYLPVEGFINRQNLHVEAFSKEVLSYLSFINCKKERTNRTFARQNAAAMPRTFPSLKGFVQFFVDMIHIWSSMDYILCEDKFAKFLSIGPTCIGDYFSHDIRRLQHLLKLTLPSVGSVGKEYVTALHKVDKSSSSGFLAHVFNFHLEWSLCGKHTVNSIASFMNIPMKFKCVEWTPDVMNIQVGLDKEASNWSVEKKQQFLREIAIANSLAMPLTKYLTGERHE